jgi:thioredoxin reductase (NADPH)
MLDDWQASYRPEFQGVRVVGLNGRRNRLRFADFLGRNFVPHQWLNVETDEDAKQVLKNHWS